MLYLLVIGAQRSIIANDLHLCPRSVDARIAEIKRTLGASDRFHLGVGAVRSGGIDPRYPISHASARRLGADWVEPTTRGYDILRLRAGGASVDVVARKIGISASTVRRYLMQLAADNGARNAASAGALFEALGWIEWLDRGR